MNAPTSIQFLPDGSIVATWSYAEYLQSDAWRERRVGALGRARFSCQVCNSKHDLQVHHRTYERIGIEEDADLIVLCRECHELFHGKMKQPKETQ